MLECPPEPNIIIPFRANDEKSLREALRLLGVVCAVLRQAARLIAQVSYPAPVIRRVANLRTRLGNSVRRSRGKNVAHYATVSWPSAAARCQLNSTSDFRNPPGSRYLGGLPSSERPSFETPASSTTVRLYDLKF